VPGTYQITIVDRSQPASLAVTVAFTDSVIAGTRTKVYRFAADPDAASLDTMLKAERVQIFRPAAAQPAVVPGIAVNVVADPVLP
jgi:hypothetical protein